MEKNDEIFELINLVIYAFFILIAGLVLWRIAAAFQKKKAKPKSGRYFNKKHKDHWNK